MPSDAELNYLENAKKLQMYGVHIYPAKVIFSFAMFFHIHIHLRFSHNECTL